MRIISVVKRVKFVSGRMPYIILRGRWRDVVVLKIHAPTGNKIDDVKHSLYENFEHVFDKYRQLGMKVYTKLVMIMEL
jgi:hypothetical protein